MNGQRIISIGQRRSGYDHKMNIIRNHECPAVFPANVIGTADRNTMLVYDTSGYVSLSQLRGVPVRQTMELFIAALRVMEVMKDYLLLPGSYLLSRDTLFTGENLKGMKIIYVPCKPFSQKTSFIHLCNSLKEITTENGKLYLEMTSERILSTEPGIHALITYVNELIREVRMCGIE